MRRHLAYAASALLCAAPAAAIDLPERKAGLWELKLAVGNSDLPGQTMRQCIDAETDKLVSSNFGVAPQQTCDKQAMSRKGDTLTIDSVCSIAGVTSTTQAVITGSFDAAYTMHVTTRSHGAPGATRMTVDAKWLGPCEAGQRPGDMVMPNGTIMNIRDLHKMRPPAPPQR
jgi:hypothetical protein